MSRRALIPEADLRRWARVSREEGVAIGGRIDRDGGFSFTIDPFPKPSGDPDDDFDDRLARFGKS